MFHHWEHSLLNFQKTISLSDKDYEMEVPSHKICLQKTYCGTLKTLKNYSQRVGQGVHGVVVWSFSLTDVAGLA